MAEKTPIKRELAPGVLLLSGRSGSKVVDIEETGERMTISYVAPDILRIEAQDQPYLFSILPDGPKLVPAKAEDEIEAEIKATPLAPKPGRKPAEAPTK